MPFCFFFMSEFGFPVKKFFKSSDVLLVLIHFCKMKFIFTLVWETEFYFVAGSLCMAISHFVHVL